MPNEIEDFYNEKSQPKLFKINSIVFILIASAIIINLTILVYAINFWGDISGDQETWGQFGDYLGGVLNPILSFFTIFILVINSISQASESRELRAKAEKAQISSESQLKMVRDQISHQNFKTVIDSLQDEKSYQYFIKKKCDLRLHAALALACAMHRRKLRNPLLDYKEKKLTKCFTYYYDIFFKGYRYDDGHIRQVIIKRIVHLIKISEEVSDSSLYRHLVFTKISPLLVISSIMYEAIHGDRTCINLLESNNLTSLITPRAYYFFPIRSAKGQAKRFEALRNEKVVHKASVFRRILKTDDSFGVKVEKKSKKKKLKDIKPNESQPNMRY